MPITNTTTCASADFTDCANVFLVRRNKEPAIAEIETSHRMNQVGGCGNGFQGFYETV